ncbi:MAG: amidohydrolase [Gemmatimonadetes bacterium]|nr:amidohydrolase [Gemmatimonadota bacterium]
MRYRTLGALTCLLTAACDMKRDDGQRAGGTVTLAIVNARVWTGNQQRPWADAVAMAGDRIVAVGSSAEVRKLAGKAELVDAAGRMVVPGFIDAHVHFVDGGFGLSSVQLRDASTKEEFVRRIGAFAQTVPAGTWITNGDWDHTLWGGELPTKEWIDSVTPNHPVFINRLDGHMSLANTAALTAGQVTRATATPAGGEIVKDASGEPTGVLKDNAAELVAKVMPLASDEMEDRALDAAMSYVASQGVTSVHHMGALGAGGAWNELGIFRRALAAGRLKTRIYAAVPLSEWEALRDTIAASGRGDAWLRIGMLKGFVDGSLGSHTAAMFEGFTDKPSDTGLFITSPETLYARVKGADSAGLHVAVHAIGDRAINTQLGIFERVARENGVRDRRFRIEHAQHIGPNDLARFGELGVIASMQPYHAIDDGRWADRVIGAERATRTYAFRSLLDLNATMAFGSDWFVAPATPLEGIYAAVTRRTLDGRNPDGWVPDQKITVEEALRAYTTGSAYASFEEAEKGTLEVGKLADLVLIDQDLTRLTPAELKDAKVMMTVVGGKVVYRRP